MMVCKPSLRQLLCREGRCEETHTWHPSPRYNSHLQLCWVFRLSCGLSVPVHPALHSSPAQQQLPFNIVNSPVSRLWHTQHIPIYLQPFTSYSKILVGNCNFSYPLHLTPLLRVFPLEFREKVWSLKTRIMGLPGSEDSLMISWAVSTQCQRVTACCAAVPQSTSSWTHIQTDR